jgi:DNA-binding NarL/FixJ family response regulator
MQFPCRVPPIYLTILSEGLQHDLLKLLVEGLTAKEIADRMQVSIHTTSTRTRNIFT